MEGIFLKVWTKVLAGTLEGGSINDIYEPAQVISYKHQSHICTGMGDSLFCSDVIKSPLPFYNTIRMFYDGLALFISAAASFDVFLFCSI